MDISIIWPYMDINIFIPPTLSGHWLPRSGIPLGRLQSLDRKKTTGLQRGGTGIAVAGTGLAPQQFVMRLSVAQRMSFFLFLLVLVCVFSPRPAQADWLVLRSGELVETRGPWVAEDKVILFTSKGGLYSSVPLPSVDLESSRETTARGGASGSRGTPAVAREKAKKAPVLVLVDGDVARWTAAEPSSVTNGDGSTVAGARVPSSDSLERRPAGQTNARLSSAVVDWRSHDLEPGGVSISGRLQNKGDRTTVGMSVTILLTNAEGVVMAEAPARLSARALGPGSRAVFQVDFPRVGFFSRVDFVVEGIDLESTASREPDDVDSL